MDASQITKDLEKIQGEIQGKLSEIETGSREYSDQVKSEINEKLQDFQNKLSNAADQKAFDELSMKVQELKKQGMNTRKATELGMAGLIEKTLTEKADSFKAWKNKEKQGGFEVKAVGTMTTPAWSNTNIVDNTYVPGIKPEVYRQGRIRPILPAGTTTGNSVPFVYESGGEGTADVTGEGSAKNQIDKDLTLGTADVKKITAYLKVSEEMLEDVPALSAYLGFSLQNMILDKEDQQLLYGTGLSNQILGLTANTSAQTAGDISGITTSNPNNYDAIVAAKAHLASLNYRMTHVLMNPVDLATMQLAKATSNGTYLTPVFYDNGQPSIFGVPVYETTAVSAGDLIAMDGSRAAQLFQRAPLSVRFYDQNEDDAINNLVTVVAEERLALPIYYGDAIFFDTFADVITAITAS